MLVEHHAFYNAASSNQLSVAVDGYATSEDLAKCFSSREGSRSRLDDNTTSYLGGNSKVGKVQRILNVEEEVGQISHMSKIKNKIGLE